MPNKNFSEKKDSVNKLAIYKNTPNKIQKNPQLIEMLQKHATIDLNESYPPLTANNELPTADPEEPIDYENFIDYSMTEEDIYNDPFPTSFLTSDANNIPEAPIDYENDIDYFLTEEEDPFLTEYELVESFVATPMSALSANENSIMSNPLTQYSLVELQKVINESKNAYDAANQLNVDYVTLQAHLLSLNTSWAILVDRKPPPLKERHPFEQIKEIILKFKKNAPKMLDITLEGLKSYLKVRGLRITTVNADSIETIQQPTPTKLQFPQISDSEHDHIRSISSEEIKQVITNTEDPHEAASLLGVKFSVMQYYLLSQNTSYSKIKGKIPFEQRHTFKQVQEIIQEFGKGDMLEAILEIKYTTLKKYLKNQGTSLGSLTKNTVKQVKQVKQPINLKFPQTCNSEHDHIKTVPLEEIAKAITETIGPHEAARQLGVKFSVMQYHLLSQETSYSKIKGKMTFETKHTFKQVQEIIQEFKKGDMIEAVLEISSPTLRKYLLKHGTSLRSLIKNNDFLPTIHGNEELPTASFAEAPSANENFIENNPLAQNSLFELQKIIKESKNAYDAASQLNVDYVTLQAHLLSLNTSWAILVDRKLPPLKKRHSFEQIKEIILKFKKNAPKMLDITKKALENYLIKRGLKIATVNADSLETIKRLTPINLQFSQTSNSEYDHIRTVSLEEIKQVITNTEDPHEAARQLGVKFSVMQYHLLSQNQSYSKIKGKIPFETKHTFKQVQEIIQEFKKAETIVAILEISYPTLWSYLRKHGSSLSSIIMNNNSIPSSINDSIVSTAHNEHSRVIPAENPLIQYNFDEINNAIKKTIINSIVNTNDAYEAATTLSMTYNEMQEYLLSQETSWAKIKLGLIPPLNQRHSLVQIEEIVRLYKEPLKIAALLDISEPDLLAYFEKQNTSLANILNKQNQQLLNSGSRFFQPATISTANNVDTNNMVSPRSPGME